VKSEIKLMWSKRSKAFEAPMSFSNRAYQCCIEHNELAASIGERRACTEHRRSTLGYSNSIFFIEKLQS